MRLGAWGLAVVFWAAAASAQAPQSAVTAKPAEAKPAAHHEEVKIAEGDRAEWTSQAVKRMRQILTELITHLETARNERDVMLLNCINEKLTAVKGLLKISEQADVSMQEAMARRDGDAAAHEFDKIRIALGKSEELSAAAQACVGELAVYAGDTVVEVVKEGVPDEDHTDETGEDYVLERPPAASPFQ